MAKEPSRTYTATPADAGGPLTSAPKPKGKGKWKITAVLFLIVLPLAAFALWVTIALSYSYATGERAGFVQKISNKGWICKTQEGELALANGPNVMPEIFRFTVRDDAVAAQISASAGRQVKLTYDQHKGLPTSCFGETEYFVKRIEVIGAPPPAAGGVLTPAPTMVPAPTTVPVRPPVTPPVIPPTTPPTP